MKYLWAGETNPEQVRPMHCLLVFENHTGARPWRAKSLGEFALALSGWILSWLRPPGHVSVLGDEVGWYLAGRQARFYPAQRIARVMFHYYWVAVEVGADPAWLRATDVSGWRGWAHWLTRGRVRGDSCVNLVSEWLIREGIPVPAAVSTPRGLLRWLVESGNGQPVLVKASRRSQVDRWVGGGLPETECSVPRGTSG